MESIFLETPVASQKLVTDEVENPRESLNIDHQAWVNPWNHAMASTASFPQLFRQCLSKCSTIYYYLNASLSKTGLQEDVLPALLDELGNYSYHSGLPVTELY